MVRRQALPAGVIVVLALALVGPSDAIAEPPDAQGSGTLIEGESTLALVNAEELRSAAGLSSSADAIESSFADVMAYDDTSFGPPLSSAEAAVVRAQMVAQERLTVATEDAGSLPGFATEYFDGPILHVLAKNLPRASATEFLDTIPSGAMVELEAAPFDHDDLLAVQKVRGHRNRRG